VAVCGNSRIEPLRSPLTSQQLRGSIVRENNATFDESNIVYHELNLEMEDYEVIVFEFRLRKRSNSRTEEFVASLRRGLHSLC
jgi:hypothetical protein